MKTKFLLSLIYFVYINCLSAVTVEFSASSTNGLGDSFGNDLAVGNLVEVGTWDVSNSLFSTLGSTTTGTFDSFPGEFLGSTENLDTDGLNISGSQLAIRWSAEDGNIGIVYSTLPTWQLFSGDGSPTDTERNAIELADLTDDNGLNLLDSAVIVSGKFGGESVTFGGTPLFQTPEPSTYAIIAGFLTLVCVIVYRSKSKEK